MGMAVLHKMLFTKTGGPTMSCNLLTSVLLPILRLTSLLSGFDRIQLNMGNSGYVVTVSRSQVFRDPVTCHELYLKGHLFLCRKWHGLQNTQGLCYHSPTGVCQKFHTVPLPTTDTSNMRFAWLCSSSSRADCITAWSCCTALPRSGLTQNW